MVWGELGGAKCVGAEVLSAGNIWQKKRRSHASDLEIVLEFK